MATAMMWAMAMAMRLAGNKEGKDKGGKGYGNGNEGGVQQRGRASGACWIGCLHCPGCLYPIACKHTVTSP